MSPDQLQNRIDELEYAPDSPAKAAAIEALVREVDALGDESRSYSSRQSLIKAAIFGGAFEKALVAFAWCRARFDERPEDFDTPNFLWQYKWILSSIADVASISREQIHSLQNDFESRLQSHGYSLRPAFKLRMQTAFEMGDLDDGDRFYREWQNAKRDQLADCLACEMSAMVKPFVCAHQYETAVEKALAVIEGGYRCAQVPHSTYGRILRPLISLGRFDEARHFQSIGYPMVTKNPDFLDTVTQHLYCVTALDDLTRGVRLLEKHLPWAIETYEQSSRMLFLHMAALLMARIAHKRPKPRKLKLPRSLPCFRDDSTYAPADLADFFQNETAKLAAEFDRRNGNSYYASTFAADREQIGL